MIDWQNSDRPDKMLKELGGLDLVLIEPLRQTIVDLFTWYAKDLMAYCDKVTASDFSGGCDICDITNLQEWAQEWSRGIPKEPINLVSKIDNEDMAYAVLVGTAPQTYLCDNDLKKLCKAIESGKKFVKFDGMANLLRMYIPVLPGGK